MKGGRERAKKKEREDKNEPHILITLSKPPCPTVSHINS